MLVMDGGIQWLKEQFEDIQVPRLQATLKHRTLHFPFHAEAQPCTCHLLDRIMLEGNS